MGIGSIPAALATAGAALAQGANGPVQTAPSLGSPFVATQTPLADSGDIPGVVVQRDRRPPGVASPNQASLDETEPQSFISQAFLQQGRPQTGDYATAALLAPSIASVASNGGGVGETNNLSLRGFTDGQFSVTYDQIPFADTISATHHPSAYFPASTIASLVVDRGPGAAGDLGQANYGGAIHMSSPAVSDRPSLLERATYASFDTVESVTTVQSGALPFLAGTKILVNADYRSSGGELSYSSGTAENFLFKSMTPLPSQWRLTLFSSIETTQFYEFDAGPRETWDQVETYGKNYALTDNPMEARDYRYNKQNDRTDFEYIDLKGAVSNIILDDRAYTYSYAGAEVSPHSITAVDMGASSPLLGLKNPSPPLDVTPTDPATDIGGVHAGYRYRVLGDIVRFSKDFSGLSLNAGGWYEHADTYRYNMAFDLTNGNEDLGYLSLTTPAVAQSSNIKTLEYSSWNQYQLFADMDWRPFQNISIRPGFKYIDFTRTIAAPVENSGVDGRPRGSAYGSNVFTLPLYFLTANYRVRPDWSIYGQAATGFVIPPLFDLITADPSMNHDAPPVTATYQVGTVYSTRRLALDADLYTIKVRHTQVPDPTNPYDIDVGTAAYSGLEAEFAYRLDGGFSLFGNVSENVAKDTTKNLTLDPNGGKALTNAPKATAALGVLHRRGRWSGSLTYKLVGPQVAKYNAAGLALELPRYSTLDSSISYDFGRLKAKLAVFNMLDDRAITAFAGGNALFSLNSMGVYQFQAGRDIEATLEAKF